MTNSDDVISTPGGQNSENSLSDIQDIRVDLASKASTMTIIGAMIALVAIPLSVTMFWGPREFDAIQAKIDELKEQVTEVEEAQAASLTKVDFNLRFDDLIRSIAERQAFTESAIWDNNPIFEEIIPSDLLVSLAGDGKLRFIDATAFSGKFWVFISQKDFASEFSSNEQEALAGNFDRNGTEFFLK